MKRLHTLQSEALAVRKELPLYDIEATALPVIQAGVIAALKRVGYQSVDVQRDGGVIKVSVARQAGGDLDQYNLPL